jgi:hypothetical protein
LGGFETLREAAEMLIERRVLRRSAGMIDLLDCGGQTSQAVLDFKL